MCIRDSVVVRVTHAVDVPMSSGARWTQSTERMFCVCRITCQGGRDLLVDNHIDLDAALGGALQDLIESPFLVVVWRSAQEQLRRQPPVGDVDGLLCAFQGDTDGPEVIAAINVPFDLVSVSFGRKALEAVAVGYVASLLVRGLLVLFVVTMVGIDQVLELANAVFEVNSLDFGVVQMSVLEFVPKLREWVLHLLCKAAIIWSLCTAGLIARNLVILV